MPDREKVMKGLKQCAGVDCNGCPYQGISPCQNKLAADALDLLKEQEEKLKEWEKHVPFLAAHGILKGDEDDA